jgi:pilus assembly protein CpaC
MAVLNARATRNTWYRRLPRALAFAAIAAGMQPLTATVAQDSPTSQWAMTNTNVSVDKTTARQSMQMVVNTSREITASQVFKSIIIQNPNVVQAKPLEGGNRLLISATATGITQINLEGADDSVHTIEIMVLGDVRELEAILRQQFPDANLQVVPVQQGCIVSGFVTSDEHVNQVISIAELYFPTIINKVNVTGIHTIQLETQIMEVSRTKLRELGVDWAFVNGNTEVVQSVSGLLNVTGSAITTTGSETFSLGIVENSNTFFTAIRALRRNNLVKVLASPTLTAVDGRPASFNAGGEIPIVVPAGLGQVGIQFREYGTRLDYVAKVRGGGRIWLEVRPYVSEIDPSRSVNIDGYSVPGLRSRYLETGVELGAGQTLALAGLLQVKSETINLGLPILADMPWVGAFFRTTREEQNEIELLITVTPNFAGPMDPHEVPHRAPGLNTQSPTDKELYARGYVETPIDDQCEEGSMGGLIQSYPQEMLMPANGLQSSGDVQGSSISPSSIIPNPAAMSVGPNAPRLAQQPDRFLQPPNVSTPKGGNTEQPVGQPRQSGMTIR